MTFKFKIFILLTLVIVFNKSFSQTKQADSFKYKDKFGNHISLYELNIYPEKIDSTFFKQSLTGLDLNNKLLQADTRYEFTIVSVVTIKANKKYKISVSMHSKSAKIDESVDGLGLHIYFLTTKKDGNKLKLDKVTFDHCEI